MHIVGRHTMVRLHGAHGISPRRVLSRHRAQWPAVLKRYAAEDWAIGPDGVAYPAISGGVGWSSLTQSPRMELGIVQYYGATQTAVALNNNYTYNSAGNAIAARITPPYTMTLASVYYFLTAHTGTPEVQIALHTDGSSKPAASPTALGNNTPGGTGWKSLTGLSQSMTGGTKYWVVISDNDGSTDGTATVLRSVSAVQHTTSRVSHTAFSTTDGWASVVTAANAVGAIVLGFSDSTAMGWPVTATTSPASSTNRRGWNLSTGLTGSAKLYGMVSGSLTNGSGVEAYEGTTIPGGSTVASGTVAVIDPAAPGATSGYLFSPAYSPPSSTAIRVVFTFSGNSTSVGRDQIGTGVDATLRAARWGASDYYYALANGTTDWANDLPDEQPQASLILEDLVAPSGGGGSRVIGAGF